MQKRKRLETALGYSFQDGELLELALTHRSYARDHNLEEDNERLEFLGDAVLELAVSEILMESCPDYTEGRLTKIRAELVRTDNLLQAARALSLGESLKLSFNEEKNGGREKKTLLADAMEAVIAAVHLDGGLAAARSLIERSMASPARIAEADEALAHLNPKSTLQELLQGRKLPPAQYTILDERGTADQRTFDVGLTVGEICTVTGSGATRRQAEQAAAAQALENKALRYAYPSKSPR
jgi:ribonuclease III